MSRDTQCLPLPYRRQQPSPAVTAVKPKCRCPRTLTEVERAETLALLHSEEFVDRAPTTVHATLLDQGRYIAVLQPAD